MALPKVFDELNKRLPLTGGAMTGALTLNGDPVANLQAVTKQYIDNQIADGVVAEAGKLSVNAGSATKPIYFDQGIPKVVGNSLNVDISGTAGKVANQLHFTIGGTDRGSYDGSSEHTIYVNAYDLNIQGALQYIGRTNTIPASANITLIDGSTITAAHGNVVIYTGNNIEYLYDTNNTWVQLGEVTNYSLTPHIHGNISSKGYLTNSSGLSLANRLLTSNGSGKIVGQLEFKTSVTTKFLNENGSWQTPSTGSKTVTGLLKVGDNINVSSGVISLSSDNVTAALGYTPMRGDRTMNYAGADTDGGHANTVNTAQASSDQYRPVWFSYVDNTKKAVYNENFRYNPATRSLEVGSITGSAAKLTTARTISLTGDVTGSATFDGSANASITATIGSISRNKLAQDALYSPVWVKGNGSLTVDEGGKTVVNTWSAANTVTWTLAQANSAEMADGTEIALLNSTGSIIVNGTGNIRFFKTGDSTIYTNGTITVSDPWGMIALKLIHHDATNGDAWLVTGSCDIAGGVPDSPGGGGGSGEAP